eukprot:9469425-Pyramimonas_sp.AAC.1
MHAKFNQEGVGRRPFADAVDHQLADKPEGGAMVDGPRACLSLVRSWRDAGLSAVTHRESWICEAAGSPRATARSTSTTSSAGCSRLC